MKFLSETVAFQIHREEKEFPEEEEFFSYSSEEELSDAEQQLQQLLGKPSNSDASSSLQGRSEPGNGRRN